MKLINFGDTLKGKIYENFPCLLIWYKYATYWTLKTMSYSHDLTQPPMAKASLCSKPLSSFILRLVTLSG